MKKLFNNRGETLAETIVALSVLAIGITVASTIVLNSIRNLTNAKSRVLAVNIAREGVEAVRGIRDSNWLFYSDRRRQCWNHNPAEGACEGLTPILPGTYIVYKHANGSWQVEPTPNNLDEDLSLLTRVNISLMLSPEADDDGDLIPNTYDPEPANPGIYLPLNTPNGFLELSDFYNHKTVPNSMGIPVLDTNFSRVITVEYLANDGTVVDTQSAWDAFPGGDQTPLNRMRVTSIVEWTRGSGVHKVELTTILTDHLGRENLSN
ncbi:MAG: type II secretion system GspH family protein [Candidatus Peregrinibacteria bacterium]|nr:type II secretion system GspH family protein [Candidatus Peregrinibacteria bacterium]